MQFSDEHRRKLSESAKKRWQDPKYREEMASIVISDDVKKAASGRMKIKWKDPEYRESRTGHKHLEETKHKISEKAKTRWANLSFKLRMSETMKASIAERGCSDETRAKLSKAINERLENPEYRKQMSENSKMNWQDPDYRKRTLKAREGLQVGENHPMYGRKHSKETRKKLSISHMGNALSEANKQNISKANKKVWANLTCDQKTKWIMNNRASQRQSPTKPERTIRALLNNMYPGEWRFVGNGQVVINGKIPDFININGQKKIIEVFGDYWHRNDDPKDRAKVFKPYGYKTLVIWESEIKADLDAVKEKITSFMVI